MILIVINVKGYRLFIAARRGAPSRRALPAVAALLAAAAATLASLVPAQAQQTTQFLYGITDGGGLYEVDTANKTTTLAFSTGLQYMNGLALDATDAQGAGLLLYRAGTSSLNGSTGLYVWNRASNTQKQITYSGGTLPGQSSNASWYNGAYWYVQQSTDTLTKATIDFTNPNAPFVSSLTNYANFDGTSRSSYSFGDISISSSGLLYGSVTSLFFHVDVSSGAPVSSTYSEFSSGSQVQLGFGSDGTTLYGEAAGSGTWYTVNTATGAQTALGFTSAQSFNDISEGSSRSASSAAAPEPGSLALLAIAILGGLPAAYGVGRIACRRRCQGRHVG